MCLLQFFYKVGKNLCYCEERGGWRERAKMQSSRLPHCVRNDKMIEING